MRAPPLARMAAVAAPRPEAEPVTIAHETSPDIRIPHVFWLIRLPALYHIVQGNACKSPKLCCAELMRGQAAYPRCRAVCGHQRLSWLRLFLIMPRKKSRRMPGLDRPAGCEVRDGERCGRE